MRCSEEWSEPTKYFSLNGELNICELKIEHRYMLERRRKEEIVEGGF